MKELFSETWIYAVWIGKVEFLDLYPLNFTEFLIATGKEQFIELLQKGDFAMVTNFKTKYIDTLKHSDGFHVYAGAALQNIALFRIELPFFRRSLFTLKPTKPLSLALHQL